MSIHVNGEPSALSPGTSVAALVDEVAPSPKGIAVAVNGDVVPRSAWDDVTLTDGDRVEVLGAAQGG
jgi:sulfur carrier protein